MKNIIFQRTSVRKYTSEGVSTEQIETLLKAGMAAPSARNIQPWEFIVVQDRALLDTISELGSFAHMLKEAPLAIIVCADLNKEMPAQAGKHYWIQDCSAATQNIMLQATELGLGSVWIGTFPKEEMYKPLAQLLELPENIIAVTTIAIGHPEGEIKPKDKFDKTKIHINKW